MATKKKAAAKEIPSASVKLSLESLKPDGARFTMVEPEGIALKDIVLDAGFFPTDFDPAHQQIEATLSVAYEVKAKE